MDFLKAFDARTAAETAINLDLRDPTTGDVIMDNGAPCTVLILGASSRSVQEALKQEALERARKMKGKTDQAEPDTQVVSDLHESACRSATRLIVGFRNIRTTGETGPRDLTLDDVPTFLDLTFFSMPHALRQADDRSWQRPSFAQQILDAATDDARFLTRPATA